MPGLGIVFRDDVLSQGVREALLKEVQSAFFIQPITCFGSQGLESGDIGVQIYALHADAVQLCCCILLFGRVRKGLVEFSDEMSPIDRIGGGNLNVVGVRVRGGTLFIDPVMLNINPIVNYVAFEEAKGKEGFLHRVIHHVASFIESKVYVQFPNKSLGKGAISSEDGRGVS
jgi:hypothetical protein